MILGSRESVRVGLGEISISEAGDIISQYPALFAFVGALCFRIGRRTLGVSIGSTLLCAFCT